MSRRYMRLEIDAGYAHFLGMCGWMGFEPIHARLYKHFGPDYGRRWELVHAGESTGGVVLVFGEQ